MVEAYGFHKTEGAFSSSNARVPILHEGEVSLEDFRWSNAIYKWSMHLLTQHALFEHSFQKNSN
jgi:hypothetical protein